jgi:hypothetical protein
MHCLQVISSRDGGVHWFCAQNLGCAGGGLAAAGERASLPFLVPSCIVSGSCVKLLARGGAARCMRGRVRPLAFPPAATPHKPRLQTRSQMSSRVSAKAPAPAPMPELDELDEEAFLDGPAAVQRWVCLLPGAWVTQAAVEPYVTPYCTTTNPTGACWH